MEAAVGNAPCRESMFMVTELCWGGSLREKVLAQMVAGRRKVRQRPVTSTNLEMLSNGHILTAKDREKVLAQMVASRCKVR